MRGLISEPAFAVSPCSWEQYSQRKGVRQEEIYNLDRFSRNDVGSGTDAPDTTLSMSPLSGAVMNSPRIRNSVTTDKTVRN